jgi:hypothetical protein
MYLAKSFIAPAIHLIINQYSQATAYHSPNIYLKVKHSVKIHKEAGETFMHSVLLYLHCLTAANFVCIGRHQQLVILSL